MGDPTPQDPPTEPTPAAPPAEPAKTDPPAEPAKQPPWGDPENFNAEKAWELIQNLRTEKGDPEKVTALQGEVDTLKSAQQEQMDAIAKALGLKPDDTPADPAKLAEEIKAEQGKTADAETRATSAERQLAVFKAAPALEGDALALLDSASFLASIKDIGPGDEDKLNEAIKTAVEANDRFKATPAPGSPRLPGGPRIPAPPARAGSLAEAVGARLSSQSR